MTISMRRKLQKVFKKVIKHCRKRRNCSLTSNFSFSHSVFKRLVLQTRKNQGLFGKGFNLYQRIPGCNDTIEEAFWKNGKYAGYQHILLFPKCFLPFPKQISIFHFNPFPNKPWILRVCSRSPSKTLWEKEKLLITSNFSFSHSVSTRLENFLPYSSNLKLLSARSFSLEVSKICHLGKR